MDRKRRNKVNDFHAYNDNAWRKICDMKIKQKVSKRKWKHVRESSPVESVISSAPSPSKVTGKILSRRERRTDDDERRTTDALTFPQQVFSEETHLYELPQEESERIPVMKREMLESASDLSKPQEYKTIASSHDIRSLLDMSLAAIEMRKNVMIKKRLRMFQRLFEERTGEKDKKSKETSKCFLKDTEISKQDKYFKTDLEPTITSSEHAKISKIIVQDTIRTDYNLKKFSSVAKKKGVKKDLILKEKELSDLKRKVAPKSLSQKKVYKGKDKDLKIFDIKYPKKSKDAEYETKKSYNMEEHFPMAERDDLKSDMILKEAELSDLKRKEIPRSLSQKEIAESTEKDLKIFYTKYTKKSKVAEDEVKELQDLEEYFPLDERTDLKVDRILKEKELNDLNEKDILISLSQIKDTDGKEKEFEIYDKIYSKMSKDIEDERRRSSHLEEYSRMRKRTDLKSDATLKEKAIPDFERKGVSVTLSQKHVAESADKDLETFDVKYTELSKGIVEDDTRKVYSLEECFSMGETKDTKSDTILKEKELLDLERKSVFISLLPRKVSESQKKDLKIFDKTLNDEEKEPHKFEKEDHPLSESLSETETTNHKKEYEIDVSTDEYEEDVLKNVLKYAPNRIFTPSLREIPPKESKEIIRDIRRDKKKDTECDKERVYETSIETVEKELMESYIQSVKLGKLHFLKDSMEVKDQTPEVLSIDELTRNYAPDIPYLNVSESNFKDIVKARLIKPQTDVGHKRAIVKSAEEQDVLADIKEVLCDKIYEEEEGGKFSAKKYVKGATHYINPNDIKIVQVHAESELHKLRKDPKIVSLADIIKNCASEPDSFETVHLIAEDTRELEYPKFTTSISETQLRAHVKPAEEDIAKMTTEEIFYDYSQEIMKEILMEDEEKETLSVPFIYPNKIQLYTPLTEGTFSPPQVSKKVSLNELLKEWDSGFEFSTNLEEESLKDVTKRTKSIGVDIESKVRDSREKHAEVIREVFYEEPDKIIEEISLKDDLRKSDTIKFIDCKDVQSFKQLPEMKLHTELQKAEEASLEQIVKTCSPKVDFSHIAEKKFKDTTEFEQTKYRSSETDYGVVKSAGEHIYLVVTEGLFAAEAAEDAIKVPVEELRKTEITSFIDPKHIEPLLETKRHSEFQKAEEASLEQIVKTCSPEVEFSNILEQTFRETTDFKQPRYKSSETDFCVVKSAEEHSSVVVTEEIFEVEITDTTAKVPVKDLTKTDITSLIDPNDVETLKELPETELHSEFQKAEKASLEQILKTCSSEIDFSNILEQKFRDTAEFQQNKYMSSKTDFGVVRSREEYLPVVATEGIFCDKTTDSAIRVSEVKRKTDLDEADIVSFIKPGKIEVIKEPIDIGVASVSFISKEIIPDETEMSAVSETDSTHVSEKLFEDIYEPQYQKTGLLDSRVEQKIYIPSEISITLLETEEEHHPMFPADELPESPTDLISEKTSKEHAQKETEVLSFIIPKKIQTITESLDSEMLSLVQISEVTFPENMYVAETDISKLSEETFENIFKNKQQKPVSLESEQQIKTLITSIEENGVVIEDVTHDREHDIIKEASVTGDQKRIVSESLILPDYVKTISHVLENKFTDTAMESEEISVEDITTRCAPETKFKKVVEKSLTDTEGFGCSQILEPERATKYKINKISIEEQQSSAGMQTVFNATSEKYSKEILTKDFMEESKSVSVIEPHDIEILKGTLMPDVATNAYEPEKVSIEEIIQRCTPKMNFRHVSEHSFENNGKVKHKKIGKSIKDVKSVHLALKHDLKSSSDDSSVEDQSPRVISERKRSIYVPLLEDRKYDTDTYKGKITETDLLEDTESKMKTKQKRIIKTKIDLSSKDTEKFKLVGQRQQIYGDLKEGIEQFEKSLEESSSQDKSKEKKFTITSSEKSDDYEEQLSSDLKSSEAESASVLQHFQTIEDKLKHAEKRLSLFSRKVSIESDLGKKRYGQKQQTEPSLYKPGKTLRVPEMKMKELEKDAKLQVKKSLKAKSPYGPSSSKFEVKEQKKGIKDTPQVIPSRHMFKMFSSPKSKSSVSNDLLEKTRAARLNKGLVLNTSLYRRFGESDKEKNK